MRGEELTAGDDVIYRPAGDKEPQYTVSIYHTETGELVKKMGPMSERKADKVYDGASRNLNHDEYHIEIDRVEDSE